MPWLAHALPDAAERDAVLSVPCSCCAANPCACVAAACRDSHRCTRHCPCDHCTAAWASDRPHAEFYPGTDGTSLPASAIRPGPGSEDQEDSRATTSP